MRAYKQEPEECILATIASLSGVPLHVIRKKALKMANGVPWKQVVMSAKQGNRHLYWNVQSTLAKELGLKGLIPTSDRDMRRPPISAMGDSSVQRGSIVISYLTSAHIVPFEGSFVYDSGPGMKESIDEWLSRIREEGWVVYGVWGR